MYIYTSAAIKIECLTKGKHVMKCLKDNYRAV